MTDRLTGEHPISLTFTDRYGDPVQVSVLCGRVRFDTDEDSAGAWFTPQILRFLADLATGEDAHGYPRDHAMSECYWVDCPEHKCEYTMSHTRSWCGRPTCRES